MPAERRRHVGHGALVVDRADAGRDMGIRQKLVQADIDEQRIAVAILAVGAGRLQFYSAPNLNCMMTGAFVIPKDELIAYAQSSDGWSSVMYSNPRNGNGVSGWVRSSRLKATGTVGH